MFLRVQANEQLWVAGNVACDITIQWSSRCNGSKANNIMNSSLLEYQVACLLIPAKQTRINDFLIDLTQANIVDCRTNATYITVTLSLPSRTNLQTKHFTIYDVKY